MSAPLQLPLTLELPWPPVSGNTTTRHAAGRHYTQEAVKAYRRAVQALVNPGGARGPIAGPMRASWLFAPPDLRRRDVDNVLKVVQDALSRAGLWEDDSGAAIPQGSWQWCEPHPGGGIQLTLEAL
jgi:crossover junction endodeoxyribonuclease RusA